MRSLTFEIEIQELDTVRRIGGAHGVTVFIHENDGEEATVEFRHASATVIEDAAIELEETVETYRNPQERNL